MGAWEPKDPRIQQMSLFGFSTEELVANTGVSREDMAEWQKLGWLSFCPPERACYQPFDLNEVRFIASLVRFGLSRPMIHRMLSGLARPYRYDPELIAYSFFKQRWQQLPAVSEEHLREAHLEEFREGLRQEIEDYVDELTRNEDLEELENLLTMLTSAVDLLRSST